jgi:hypothetical protein
MAEINLLALFVAALVTLPIGYVWYGLIFGKAWMAATGMTEEKAKNSNPAIIYGLSLLFSFFMAFILQFIVVHQWGVEGLVAGKLGKLPSYVAFAADYSNEFRTFGHGALHGFMTGIFFIFPIIAINALYEQKSWKYILINSGYWTLCLLVMGGIICGWK